MRWGQVARSFAELVLKNLHESLYSPWATWSHALLSLFWSVCLYKVLPAPSLTPRFCLTLSPFFPPRVAVKSLGPSSQYPLCQCQQAALLCSPSKAMLKAQLCHPPRTEPVLWAWPLQQLSTKLTRIYQVLRVPDLSTVSRCGLITTG